MGSKGMQLGKKGAPKADYAKVLQEENIPDVSTAPTTKGSTGPVTENVTSNTKCATNDVTIAHVVGYTLPS